MTSRSSKHAHTLQVISHTLDWMRVLVNCADLSCNYGAVIKPKRNKVAEHLSEVMSLRHLCCE